MEQSPADETGSPLNFGNERKIRKQMRKRRITEEMIRSALTVVPEQWHGKKVPRYAIAIPRLARLC